MRSLVIVASLLVSTAAGAVPVTFSGVFGSNTPNTQLTAPEEAPFAFSFDAPATIGSSAINQIFSYTFGGRTVSLDGYLTIKDNGNGTDTLSAQIFTGLTGVIFTLTAPAFVSGGAFVAGSYAPTASNGLAIVGEAGTQIPFSFQSLSNVVVGTSTVAEAPAAALLGLGLVATAVRRRARA